MDAVDHQAHVEQLEPLAAVLAYVRQLEDSLAVGLAVSRRLVGCPANRWPGVCARTFGPQAGATAIPHIGGRPDRGD